jgi:uncharacterized Tic20 family protein
MTTPPGAGAPPPPPPPPPPPTPPARGPGPSEPPHPSGTTQDERTWALLSHVGCIIGAWAAMAFLVPLVIMLVKGKDSAFVREHAVESLNFQLSMLIYGLVGFVLVFVVVGFVVLPVLAVMWIVFVILATMRASDGQPYRYPVTIRFVH